MSNFSNILIGAILTIILEGILYLFRFRMGFIVNLIFFRVYPNVSGKYNCFIYSMTFSEQGIDKDPGKVEINKDTDKLLSWLKEQKKESYMMELRQFAYKISGTIKTFNDGVITEEQKITGKITPSRILILNWESKDPKHHNFGTYLFKLTNRNKFLKGTLSFLCIECGDPSSKYVLLEKQ